MQLIIAEKPSVARDLARVLGVPSQGKTYFSGAGRVITWCVGHLVELEEPATYDAKYKSWRLHDLPILPQRFLLRPSQTTTNQWNAVRALLTDKRCTEVVNACDAGREGELIFRYVYELSQSTLPIRRLWISSLTDEAIQAGFANLRPGQEFEPLADAARCRSEADWLVGLNATRAVTTRNKRGNDSPLYSIGRVQTPTLALLVKREDEVVNFVPRDYWEVYGDFRTASGELFRGLWSWEKKSRLTRLDLANDLIARCNLYALSVDPNGPRVSTLQKKTIKEAPPLLFDLTSLQRTANRRFGFSAARTLEIAQALYENHKILTYPRTDSRHLSRDMIKELPKIFGGLSSLEDYSAFVATIRQAPIKTSKRFFDDAKVSDHHAIIPTGKVVKPHVLDGDERKIYDLVVRRFLGAFFPDAEFASTEITVLVGEGSLQDTKATAKQAAEPKGSKTDAQSAAETAAAEEEARFLDKIPPPPDRFTAKGRVRLLAGWQEVAGIEGARSDEGPEGAEVEQSLPAVKEGDRLDGSFLSMAKKTNPPPRYTEATLLGAMETAGKSIEDEEQRLAMKDGGLGTPATRAATIETLLKRGYAFREKKLIRPTPAGIALIQVLPVESLRSAQLTGAWEARLAKMARREETRNLFMADIFAYVRQIVTAIRSATSFVLPAATPQSVPAAATATPRGRVASSGQRAAPSSYNTAPAAAAPKKRSRKKTTANNQTAPAAPTVPSFDVSTLRCPKCHHGVLMTGRKAWGCTRWREGCNFVLPFVAENLALRETQVRDLVQKGKTRSFALQSPSGEEGRGHWQLDATTQHSLRLVLTKTQDR